MALRSGMLAQFGLVDEVTYGTPVVAGMTFLPLESESLGQEIDQIESNAQFAGRRVLASDQWGLGRTKVGGDVGLELTNKNLRTAMKHMFGGESGSGPYTYTPGDLTGLSFTAQVGKPGTAGVVHPHTYSGCKVGSWEIAVKEGEIATLGLTVVAQREIGWRTVADGVNNTTTLLTSATAAFGPDDVGKPISGTNIAANTTIAAVVSTTNITLSQAATGTGSSQAIVIGLALATASYTSAIKPLHFAHATFTIGGTAVKLKGASFKGDNGLEERRFNGQRYTEEPLEAALREYTAELEPEFSDRTQYNRFVNGTEAAIVATISNGTDSVTITTNARFDGETAKVEGRGLLGQKLPVKLVGPTTDAGAITVAISQA